jgi:very-short-patch-repair endonuclease
MNPKHNARRLRRKQTEEEKQLWRALRAGRFAGFKFRRQHPAGKYFLDFYCALAKLSVELDGSQHGMPKNSRHDQEREQWLDQNDIEELRFWNHQWRKNSEGILLEIWHVLHRRTGCVEVVRMTNNRKFAPPDPNKLIGQPLSPALSPLLRRGARVKDKPSSA